MSIPKCRPADNFTLKTQPNAMSNGSAAHPLRTVCEQGSSISFTVRALPGSAAAALACFELSEVMSLICAEEERGRDEPMLSPARRPSLAPELAEKLTRRQASSPGSGSAWRAWASAAPGWGRRARGGSAVVWRTPTPRNGAALGENART